MNIPITGTMRFLKIKPKTLILINIFKGVNKVI